MDVFYIDTQCIFQEQLITNSKIPQFKVVFIPESPNTKLEKVEGGSKIQHSESVDNKDIGQDNIPGHFLNFFSNDLAVFYQCIFQASLDQGDLD